MSAASLLSAANLDHGAVGGGGNGKHARVGSLLAIHGGRDDGQQLLVRGTLPHGVTQTHLVGSEQTHLEIAISHETQAVAIAAEGAGHAGHKAHCAPEPGDAEVFGHLPSRVRKTVQAGGVVRIDALRHFGIGDHLGVAPHVAVEGHVLNEAYVEGRLPRQLHEVQQLVIILPPHHHHVHLDRVKSLSGRVENGVQHARQPPPPRHGLKPLFPQRVQADVQQFQPGSLEGGQLALQGDAVGGEPHGGHSGQPRQPLRQLHDILPDGGLPARQPYLGYARRREQPRQSHDLGSCEQMLRRSEVHAISGHAVQAPQVAPLGH
mmetsp:Transcript_17055/g.50923  ORF Transcript_17055/g.50923 Transcript_17055/m.50923 type:complete len:320 (+) Transcript_17055:1915-2874(+)